MNFKKIMVWAVTIFIGLVFLMSGSGKLMALEGWRQQFAGWGLPPWFVPVTAVLEMVGGLLILWPRTATYGGALIAVTMIGAAGTHFMAGEYPNLMVPLIFGSMASFVAWYRCPWGADNGEGAAEVVDG